VNKLGLLARLTSGLLRAPRTLGFAESFLAAWNAHDAERVGAMVGNGDYADPLSKGRRRAAALREHAQMLFTAFPDLALTLDGPITVGDAAVAARYTLSGTNTGALPGGLGIEQVDPTGKRIRLEATIFLRFGNDGAVEVDNLFDLEALAEQLGFYALLMPRTQGHYQFGAFYRLNKGNVQPPEAIGITWLQLRDPDQFENAARVTNAVAESFADRPGFVTGIVGARPPDEHGHSSGFTLSAWENLEALEANLLPNATHQDAVHQFMKEGLAWGTHSRVYQLVRAKPVMIACRCGKKNNAHKKVRTCSACGAVLDPAPVYW
jgi:predicted ester cyclase